MPTRELLDYLPEPDSQGPLGGWGTNEMPASAWTSSSMAGRTVAGCDDSPPIRGDHELAR